MAKIPTKSPVTGYSFYDWGQGKHRTFKTLDSAVVQASTYLRYGVSSDMAQGLMWGEEYFPEVDLMKNGRYYGTLYITKDIQTVYLVPSGGRIAYPIMEKGGVVLNGPINRAALSKRTAGYYKG